MASLFVLTAIMAVAVFWLLRQTVHVKPWVEDGPHNVVAAQGSFSVPPVKVGLGVFLAVATSLFALMISAYFMRMMVGDWNSLVFPSVLWLNTGVLILSDVAMRSARRAAQGADTERVRNALAAAGVCSFAFLAGQVWAWQQLNASGYFAAADGAGAVAASPANAFFYLFTALHGLHLLGGLWVWGRTTAKVWGGVELAHVRSSVELCTLYWHYLLLVWLVLFALLTPAVSELCRGRLF
jgi:cytochrome c oxidase subunit 3